MAKLLGWYGGQDGPTVLMPVEIVPLWEGADPPSNGRIVEAEVRYSGYQEACDYDRACDASDHECGEVFSFGSSAVYVPSYPGQIVAFQSDDPTQQYILELFAYDGVKADRNVLQRALQVVNSSDPTPWQKLGEIACPSGNVWAFHAADSGKEALKPRGAHMEKPFSFQLEPGVYELSYANWIDPKLPEWENGLIWLKKMESEESL